jgi:hypothetical protein
MATVYTLIATKCPAIPARTTFLDYTTGAAALYPDESTQATISKTRVGAISKKVEAACAGGTGAYAIDYGLALTDSGTSLVLAVATGQATIDGPVILGTAGTVGLTDNVYNWIYLLQNGTLTKTSSATDTPPAAPSSTCVFLGRVTVASGAITQIDGSGVLYFRGGSLCRQTGDATVPGDTPPSLLILTQTLAGRYLWDGSAYVALRNQDGRLAKTITDANYTLTSTEYVKRILAISGTLTAGRDIVLPNIDGYEYIVFNNTTQILTFKVTGQTGVAVAAGKRAILYCNSVDYVRVTADT